MNKIQSLNIFFGSLPDTDFIDDLSEVKSEKEEEVIKLFELVLKWYNKEDIDKEWSEWSKDFKEDELKKKRAIIRALIFISKEFASSKINEIELKEDFESIGLSSKLYEYFIDKLRSNEDFKIKASREKKPCPNIVKSIDWRIDERKYVDGNKEKIATVEFFCSIKGEKEIVQLDFSKKSLTHLISLLNKINEEL
jgi:hypothetical protein